MKWFNKLLIILIVALTVFGICCLVFGVYFKYNRNEYIDSINIKFSVAAETGGIEATSNNITTQISLLNYNTILFYLTREPAFTLSRPKKDATSIDLLLAKTEHIVVYSTNNEDMVLVCSEANGKTHWHRLTYRNLFSSLQLAISPEGFREPNTLLPFGM